MPNHLRAALCRREPVRINGKRQHVYDQQSMDFFFAPAGGEAGNMVETNKVLLAAGEESGGDDDF